MGSCEPDLWNTVNQEIKSLWRKWSSDQSQFPKSWSHHKCFIAEHLSVRLLIVQYSQFRFVSMYVYIYIYIRHALIVWAWFLWSRPQTTSHVVLVQPNEIVQEPKWNGSRPSVIVLESKNENKRTLHQKSDNDSTAVCIFAFRDLHDTSLTSWNFSHNRFATFTTILSPVPSTYTLHVVTTDIYLQIFFCTRHTPSYIQVTTIDQHHTDN